MKIRGSSYSSDIYVIRPQLFIIGDSFKRNESRALIVRELGNEDTETSLNKLSFNQGP